MDRKRELIAAMVVGIKAYLDTARGAQACGAGTQVNIDAETNTIEVVCGNDAHTFLIHTAEFYK